MARSDSGSLGQSAANIPLYKIGAVFYGLWGVWHYRSVA